MKWLGIWYYGVNGCFHVVGVRNDGWVYVSHGKDLEEATQEMRELINAPKEMSILSQSWGPVKEQDIPRLLEKYEKRAIFQPPTGGKIAT